MKAHPYATIAAGQRRRYERGQDGALPQPATWRSGWRESEHPARLPRKMSRGDAIQWTILGLCGLYFVAQIIRAAVTP
jgi:hypothetical protein